jgi:uncharacterized protein (UPF0333 family)
MLSEENRAQISIEMIIVFAAIIAAAIILVNRLQLTAQKGVDTIGTKSEDVYKKIDALAKVDANS